MINNKNTVGEHMHTIGHSEGRVCMSVCGMEGSDV